MSENTAQPVLSREEWLANYERELGEQQKEAPVPAVADMEITAVDGDKGVTDYLADMAFGASAGANKAVNEVMDLSWGVVNFAKEAWDKGVDNAEYREPTPEEQEGMFRLPVYREAETLPGKLTQGISQFVTGFATTGAAMKAAKFMQGAGGLTQLARPMVQGAVTDFAGFDAHEERLSNLVEQYPALSGPITAYLAADDDDSMIEGRLKNALEGLGLGVVMDGLVQGLKSLKGLRKATTQDEAISALEIARPDPQLGKEINAPQNGENIASISPVETRKADTPSVDTQVSQKQPSSAPPYKEAELSTDQMKGIVDKAADAGEAIREITYNTNLNRMTFNSSQGSHIIKSMGDALADKTLKAAGPEAHTKILTDTTAELKEFGVDYTEAIAKVGSNPKALHGLTRRMLANRNILHMMTTEMSRLAAKIDGGVSSRIDQAQFAMLTKNIQEMHLQTADMRTEVGRALSAMKIEVNDATAESMLGTGDDFLKNWFSTHDMTNESATAWLSKQGWTADQMKQLAKDVQSVDGYASAVGKIGITANPGSWWNAALELRIGNMLSSPVTWVTNFGGNLLKAYSMPVAQGLGGVIRRDPVAIQAATQTFYGLHMFLGESYSMAKRSFMTAENILDARSGILETPTHQASYEGVKSLFLRGKPEGGVLNPMQENIARGIGYLGTIARMPSHVMVGTDELFKQIMFRADLRAKLYNEATFEKGMKNANDIATHIETNMRKAFDKNGAAVKGELTTDSLLAAQRSTWTQDLGKDTFMGGVQSFAYAHPSFRLVALPFIKTPTNLMRDFGAHTFFAPLSRNYKEAVAKGGEEAARAQGQVALGTLTMCSAAMLVAGGFITGSPPKNPKERAALEATGFEPYSIKIGDRYFSFRRLDPVGMFLGSVADIMSVAQDKESLDEITLEELRIKTFAALLNNLTSKTYVQSLSEVLDYVQNPERYGNSFLGRMASTYVPASGFLRTVRKVTDPHMREMESMSDYVLNILPVGSNFLPARHNWVTGGIVDYRLIYGEDNNNMVLEELNQLGTSVTGAPKKELEGVKLNAEQYSKLCELHGTVRLGGKTMSEALEGLFSRRDYDRNREQRPDAPDGMPNPRATMANKLIDRYRKAAQQQLKKDDPELMEQVRESEVRRRASKRGMLNKSNEQEVLDKLLKR